MSKTFIFLCLLFLLVLGIYVWLVYNPAPIFVKNVPYITPSNQILPQQVVLTFSPSSLSASSGAVQTVAVQIQTKNVSPSLIELEFSYDPSVLTNVSINQGSYFSHPVIPLNVVDTSAGRISYALQEQNSPLPPQSSHGIVAYITFTTAATYLPLQSQITFLPRTLVHAQSEKNLLTGNNELSITILPLVAPAPLKKITVIPTNMVAPKTPQAGKK